MEIRWVLGDDDGDHGTVYIVDYKRFGDSTGSMAGRIYSIGGVWRGLYWPRGCGSLTRELPECAAKQEAVEVMTALLRLEN